MDVIICGYICRQNWQDLMMDWGRGREKYHHNSGDGSPKCWDGRVADFERERSTSHSKVSMKKKKKSKYGVPIRHISEKCQKALGYLGQSSEERRLEIPNLADSIWWYTEMVKEWTRFPNTYRMSRKDGPWLSPEKLQHRGQGEEKPTEATAVRQP